MEGKGEERASGQASFEIKYHELYQLWNGKAEWL
jgi:hypothetical protein